MKTKIVLKRNDYLEKQTLGSIFIMELKGQAWEKKYEYLSLELPWLKNKNNVSCVPPGVYPLKKRWSPRHGYHLHITPVPGRKWILIHPGNYHTETRGCIFPGLSYGDINKDGVVDVKGSRKALNEMLFFLPKETIIEIME